MSRAESTRRLRQADAARLALFYGEWERTEYVPKPGDRPCGFPNYTSSHNRHLKAGEDCALCREHASTRWRRPPGSGAEGTG